MFVRNRKLRKTIDEAAPAPDHFIRPSGHRERLEECELGRLISLSRVDQITCGE